MKQHAQQLQLQARAEHLSRVGHRHLERYARRVDAHEKIILGALVKKAGLDGYRIEQRPNGAKTSSNRLGIDNVSATYDRAPIFGALLWLASVLKQPDNTVVV